MSKPLVSVIIPCYNDEKYIEKAVQSILAQTYEKIEIIVVDDGSNKPTKIVLEKLRSKIALLISQENQGQSIARNNGIKRANGEYILNLDSDDYFEPSFCSKAIEAFERNDEIAILTCQAHRFNKKGPIDIFTPRGGNIKDFLLANSALGSSMFKRSDWVKVGGYEESLPILGMEDWDFYISILKNGGFAEVLKEPLFHYQIRQNSTTARIKDIKHDKFKEIIFKHQDLYQENFQILITVLIEKLKTQDTEINKKIESLDFKIGKVILKPIRFLKSLKYS